MDRRDQVLANWETPRMRNLFVKMWKDDAGIVAFEYLLVATIIGLGLVVGLTAVSAALNAELDRTGQRDPGSEPVL